MFFFSSLPIQHKYIDKQPTHFHTFSQRLIGEVVEGLAGDDYTSLAEENKQVNKQVNTVLQVPDREVNKS